MGSTSVHIPGFGWWYAVTLIDYFSRYLLAIRLCDSFRAEEINEALSEGRREAERIHGSLGAILFLVTDNGSSFLAKKFREFIEGDYSHVRIKYRTPTQLGLLERFHETLKDEEVYWNLYESPSQARLSLRSFQERYNWERPHWALAPEKGGDPVAPADVYAKGVAVKLPKWQGWAKAAKEKLAKMLAEEPALLAG